MSLRPAIENLLGCKIADLNAQGGGLFATYRAKLEDGKTVFVKYQKTPSKIFLQEAEEIRTLGQFIHTPKIIAADENFLIMDWVKPRENPDFQTRMGIELANLHRQKNVYFGWDFDNKIGRTPQPNAVDLKIQNWGEFFWRFRLDYQIKRAAKNRLLDENLLKNLRSLEKILPKFLRDDTSPSLIHGDLWAGNIISGEHHPYFIDPAPYYGDREADFALTFMFGGFDDGFYQAYQAEYPLADDFEKRKPLYMLYHYLNHLNLFGGSYLSGVRSCVLELSNK